jgi:hypothetical protein
MNIIMDKRTYDSIIKAGGVFVIKPVSINCG